MKDQSNSCIYLILKLQMSTIITVLKSDSTDSIIYILVPENTK